MSDIQDHETMWFPRTYGGRKGDYAKKVSDVSLVELTELVQKRAEEDGTWTIENNHVGDNEDVMRKMMAWVSNPVHIQQCVGHVIKEGKEEETTVDWICRDLANASRWIMGTKED